VFFSDKRVSSSGLLMWDGEPEEPNAKSKGPTGPSGTPAVADPLVIPGLQEGETGDAENAGSEPIPGPANALERVEVKRPKPTGSPGAAAATGEVTLALLPEATVFRGKDELAKGSLVSFKLPPGTHMLTILGTDGVKRRLSLKVVTGKNPARRFRLDDLPAQ
jgi:serine/threonine-protein kinase